MNVYQLLKGLALSAQQVQDDLSAYAANRYFGELFDKDGSPVSRHFKVGDDERELAEAPFRTHRPLGQKRVRFAVETDVFLGELPDDDDAELPASLKNIDVRLKRGLRRNAAYIRIDVEYEAHDPVESVELLHEKLLDRDWNKPMTPLEPATPVKPEGDSS